ncbi:MAG TPA: hypothetical protein VFW25_13415 [Silvibacterium sp.]|nr:hypothetical protein [Silvibacterium sp.]
MEKNQQNSPHQTCPESFADSSPVVLLSGDNTRSALMLHQALVNHGLRVHFAPSYDELEPLWQQHRNSAASPIVLLEVSGAHAVEPAVHAALQLKHRDPLLFIGYVADPTLHTSGLAGDAIFPRSPDQLANALQHHFADGDETDTVSANS